MTASNPPVVSLGTYRGIGVTAYLCQLYSYSRQSRMVGMGDFLRQESHTYIEVTLIGGRRFSWDTEIGYEVRAADWLWLFVAESGKVLGILNLSNASALTADVPTYNRTYGVGTAGRVLGWILGIPASIFMGFLGMLLAIGIGGDKSTVATVFAFISLIGCPLAFVVWMLFSGHSASGAEAFLGEVMKPFKMAQAEAAAKAAATAQK